MNRFVILLKREYWEHRGGFLWAPVWAGIVLLVMTVVGVGAGLWHTSGRFNGDVHIGVPLKKLLEQHPPEQLPQLTHFVQGFLGSYWTVIQVVLFFVLLFYLLGALYDDRKDRSILFWKSLPISDLDTVASKVVTAVVTAPVFAFMIAVAVQIAALLLLSVACLVVGLNPWTMLWSPAHLPSYWLQTFAMVPINALWALPAVGWLLLVSAFARSKPFLWGVMLPIAVGVAIAMFDVFQAFQIPDSRYWVHVFARIIASLVPLSWVISGSVRDLFTKAGDGDVEIVEVIDWSVMGAVLTSPTMWIGAAVGAAMLVGAVHYRRKRELAD
jgi:ABC-2 type transport system permease protein